MFLSRSLCSEKKRRRRRSLCIFTFGFAWHLTHSTCSVFAEWMNEQNWGQSSLLQKIHGLKAQADGTTDMSSLRSSCQLHHEWTRGFRASLYSPHLQSGRMRLLSTFALSPAPKVNANGPVYLLLRKRLLFKRQFKTNFISSKVHVYFGFEIIRSGEK